MFDLRFTFLIFRKFLILDLLYLSLLPSFCKTLWSLALQTYWLVICVICKGLLQGITCPSKGTEHIEGTAIRQHSIAFQFRLSINPLIYQLFWTKRTPPSWGISLYIHALYPASIYLINKVGRINRIVYIVGKRLYKRVINNTDRWSIKNDISFDYSMKKT